MRYTEQGKAYFIENREVVINQMTDFAAVYGKPLAVANGLDAPPDARRTTPSRKRKREYDLGSP